jgi:hypothetical protein
LQDTKKWITNSADVKLVGHEKDALFPLATCNAAPLVASGGTDKLLLLWDLRDVQDGLLAKRDKDDEQKTTELQHRWALLLGDWAAAADTGVSSVTGCCVPSCCYMATCCMLLVRPAQRLPAGRSCVPTHNWLAANWLGHAVLFTLQAEAARPQEDCACCLL